MCDDDIDDDGPIICWCGAVYEVDESVFQEKCGGLGVLYCYCGGDMCVCHHHGEVECPGCQDCEPEDFGEGLDYYDPDEDDE